MRTDTDRLNWLIKQGPPGAVNTDFGLTADVWNSATCFVTNDRQHSTDQKCVRLAIDEAMDCQEAIGNGNDF